MKPGVYDLPPAAYYADGIAEEPSLNATVCKALIADSPLHAWTQHPKLNPDYRESTDSKFDVGTVAHALLLQGEQITEQHTAFTVNDEAVGDGLLVLVDTKPFALVVDAADWRTNAAKNTRTEARNRGLVPLLADQWAQTKTVTQAVRQQIQAINADPPLFTAGKAERVLVWRDRGDVLCRARIDWLHDSHECVDDLKTAARTANPHVWARTTMFSIGADVQAAFTLRGLRAALGVDSTFRFLIAETHPPYAVSAVTPSAQTLELANSKIDAALDKWKQCLADNVWPAFPPHVLTIDPPGWMVMQWEESQQLEEEIAA